MTTSVTIFPDDTARTRRTDPVTSHIAGDVSSRHIKQTKAAVLQLVLQEGRLPGSEINDLYNLRASRNGWKAIAFDTPRKRAGELADDGYLEVVDEMPATANHCPERVFALTDLGKRELGIQS